MPKPFPLEFRRDVVAVARKGEAPLSQIAKDFGISESCLHRWLKLADVDDGVRPGVTSIESAELRELRKRNKTDHPVGDHGNAELADLPRAAGLGDRMLAHRKRAELARLQPGADRPGAQARPRPPRCGRPSGRPRRECSRRGYPRPGRTPRSASPGRARS